MSDGDTAREPWVRPRIVIPRPGVPNGDITGPNGRTLVFLDGDIVFLDGDIAGQNGRGLVFTEGDITGPSGRGLVLSLIHI